jgi:beta-mannosidase
MNGTPDRCSRRVALDGPDGAWRLTAARLASGAPVRSVDVAAHVPGSVHGDLLRAGVIPDPLLGDHEASQHWIGESDWRYERAMPALALQADERCQLVFHGLDTLATVTLDGEVVLRSENMHRTYVVDVTDAARNGMADRRLSIEFAAPVPEALARRDRWGEMPNPYGQPYPYLRKMAANFGWDWGPTLTTSAIWRSVELVVWRTARIGAMRCSTSFVESSGGTGRGGVTVDVDLVRAPGDLADLALVVGVAGARAEAAVDPGSSSVKVRLEVDDVSSWLPYTEGAPALHDLDVVLVEVTGGAALDRARRRIGFREVTIDRTSVDDGERWAIELNGRPVWVRGVNWIPASCFPGELRPADYRRVLDEAVALGANLVRIWGGGIIEDDAFYDRCDELGLMVWQDFPFACAAYPEEELADEVVAEVRDAVDRVGSHPSLVLWCGNNENFEGWHDWGWQEVLRGRAWGRGWFEGSIPDVLARLDPMRPYIPSSPFSPDGSHPNTRGVGPTHIWNVWNDLHHHHYRDIDPAFASEFGWQAPATWATLSNAVADRPVRPDSPGMLHRQKAIDGVAKLQRWVDRLGGSADDADEWWYLTQLEQARAVESSIGHFRSLHDRCSGVVWWQLNDCWPAISWSLVDHGLRRKPAWFTARRCFAARAAFVGPEGDGPVVVLVNDTHEPWPSELVLTAVHALTGVMRRVPVPVTVAANASVRVAVVAHLGALDPDEAVVVDAVGAERVVWSPWERPQIAPSWRTEVVATDTGLRVTVTAESFVADLLLAADRLHPDAVCDAGLVHLLPGETVSMDVVGPVEALRDVVVLDVASRAPVLRAGSPATTPAAASPRD